MEVQSNVKLGKQPRAAQSIRMNVLVVHSELGVLRGGGENFTRSLFSAFADRGHDVKAAFVADHKKRYPIPLPSNIEPIPIPGWWSRNVGQEFFSSIRAYLPSREPFRAPWDRLQEALSWRTVKWHERRFDRRVERDFTKMWGEFDVVYVHCSPVLASKIARKRPTIVRLPGPASADMAPLLRQVHAVCSNGDALRRVREFLGDHAVELPIGVDTNRFKPEGCSVRSRLGWNEEDRVLGYVGRLTHIKGVDLLASAFHEVSRILPQMRLLIVGSGAEETFVRSVLAKELGSRIAHIEPDVEHEKLSDWYRAMDLLVMPSRYENFSNAMIEAMACGIPILASSVGGNKTLVKSGSGWLFECGSVSSLTSYLSRILEDRSELKVRGEVGHRYVSDRYSWETSARRLEEIMVSLLGVER